MAVEALIFLGYPLHAPGRTDRLRDTHGVKWQDLLDLKMVNYDICNIRWI